MRKILIIFIIILGYNVQATQIDKEINDILLYEEQKNIYQENLEREKEKNLVYTNLQTHNLENNNSGNCIKIKEIIFDNITIISKQKLQKLKEPYINRCNTIEQIKNLVRKVNNIYIKKAYITSRAYIKPQNLSNGVLVISAVEGKIEKVIGKNINPSLVFLGFEGNILNLRDIEAAIEQLNRLQSIKTTMELNPGKNIGYSKIVVIGKKVASSINGNLGVNNYGTKKSGKYQLSASLNWENPFNLNDKISLSLNTTNKQEKDNSSFGYSFSYAFPISKAYISLKYSYFKYEQIVNGLNEDFKSDGNSKTLSLNVEYKLFHSKTQKAKLEGSLNYKVNKNYLAGVYLDTSSSKLTIFKLGYTHYFYGKTWDAYTTLTYHRGLNWFNAKAPTYSKPTFNKFTLDISYNKNFTFFETPAKYNLSFHGQYAKKDIIGSEQIGIGGPYSVRGFKDVGQISGNMGFYLRNEFSLNYKFKNGSFNPYIALDLGVVKHNDMSNGGRIIGSAIGTRFSYKNFFIDIYKSFPIEDSNKVTYKDNGDKVVTHNHGFFGVNISYRF